MSLKKRAGDDNEAILYASTQARAKYGQLSIEYISKVRARNKFSIQIGIKSYHKLTR